VGILYHDLNLVKGGIKLFCRHCGKEIKAGSKFCEECGASVENGNEMKNKPIVNIQKAPTEEPDAKKKFYEKTWFAWLMVFLVWPVGLFLLWKNKIGGKVARIIITVVIACIGIAAFSSSKDSSNTNKPTSQTSSEATAEKKPEWVCSVEGVGDVRGWVSSNVGIAVYKIEEVNSLGNSFVSHRAQGKFVVVSIAVSNGQKDAITLDCNNFKLIDDQNREYRYSTEGSTAIQMSAGNANGFLTNVNPGIVTTIKVPFDVPKDVQGLKLKARGGFTGKEITVPLKVELVK
jgi:hypothetical protein